MKSAAFPLIFYGIACSQTLNPFPEVDKGFYKKIEIRSGTSEEIFDGVVNLFASTHKKDQMPKLPQDTYIDKSIEPERRPRKLKDLQRHDRARQDWKSGPFVVDLQVRVYKNVFKADSLGVGNLFTFDYKGKEFGVNILKVNKKNVVLSIFEIGKKS